MKVADLFVSIGLKGGEQVGKGLSGISKGMKGLVSDSVEAKVAVLGLAYGLERMVSSLGDKAIGWQQMAATSNIDAMFMQKWERAAVKNKVSADDMSASIYGVGKALAKMRVEGKSIDALGVIQQHTKGPLDLDRAYADTSYFFDKVHEYALNKSQDSATKSLFLDTLGLSRGVQSLLMTAQAADFVIPKGKSFSADEIKAAAKAGKELSGFFLDATIAGQKLVAIFSLGAVREFGHALAGAEKILKSIESMAGPRGSLYIALTGLGVAVYAAFGPIGLAMSAIGALVAEYDKLDSKEGPSWIGKAAGFLASGVAAVVAGPPTEAQQGLNNAVANIQHREFSKEISNKVVHMGDVIFNGVTGAEEAKDHFTNEMNKAANIFVGDIYARPK